MFEKLLFPGRIDYRNTKNKVVACPPPSFLCDSDGNLTPEFFQNYKSLIQKNFGIFIIESAAISPSARAWQNQIVLCEDLNFLAISELVVKMRNVDCLPMIRLYHGGINALPFKDGVVFGPSTISHPKIRVPIRELTESEIDKICEDYKRATTVAWNAGFAGIELEASEGSLIHQFLSPITNKRSDTFAFGYDNGIMILRKVVKAIKEVAPDLILSIKLSLRDLIPGGAGLIHSIETANLIKKAGVDIFHLNEGLKIGDPSCLHPYLRNNTTPAPFADDALIFKKETQSTVILSTNINNPLIAEKVIDRECCDFVSLSRTINREAEWAEMAQTNQPIEFFKTCKRCILCQKALNRCPLNK